MSNGLIEAFVNGHEDVHWRLIQSVLDSSSDTAVVPIQDLFSLGSETRMNIPGQAAGNWQWRLSASSLTPEIAARLLAMTKNANR